MSSRLWRVRGVRPRMRCSRSLLAVVLALTGGLSAVGWLMDPAAAQGRRWGPGYFPNLPVTDQNGRTLSFYDDVIKGRIVVISFVFTRCTEICPLTTARLAKVAELLEEPLRQKVLFVSLSVDPVNDTPDKLADYAAAFHSGPGWLFLTGSLENMRAINAKFGEHMRSLNDHRNEVLLGNDATGEWQRNTVFGDLTRLAMDIRSMDPQSRAEIRTPSPNPHQDGGLVELTVPGQALFAQLCAACHTFGAARVGPDLHGVAARREKGWLQSYIMSPERLRKQKDPLALELAKRFPAVRMPDLGLSRTDASDLIDYIEHRSRAGAPVPAVVPASVR